MRKKIREEYRDKSIEELEKDRYQLIKDIALLRLETKVNRPKDTSVIVKKRARLAILQTIQQEKKTQSTLQK